MFEFLFKYPLSAFSRGDLVFAGRWNPWVLALLILAAAVVLAYPLWRRRGTTPARLKPAVIWLLQTAMVAVLLVLLWQPALSVATLRPQQNIVAIVVDDSRSMARQDGSSSRIDQAKKALSGGVLDELGKKFQVRLYRNGSSLERVNSIDGLKAEANSTRLGGGLRQVVSEAASLPIGAVVVLSDGAENSGGIDLDTTNEIKRYRIPVHTVGFGRERPDRDLELIEAEMPQRILANSKLNAVISFRQFGYEGRRARINLKDGGKTLASREVTLKKEGVAQSESVVFNSGLAGVRTLQVSIDPLDGEENGQNNTLTRLVNVDATKPRVLYIEGEPKWEYKFIRRAIDADQGLQLVSMLRTTQNKIYRQGIGDPKELEEGFPATVEELFSYQAVIIGGVEANYFTPTQQELLKQFVDRRGGGLLWLAGRGGLSDGGWGAAALADLMPTVMPSRKNTFLRDPANVELTPAGRDTLLCRLEDDPQRNVERWKKLPYLANYQDPGAPKPGAVVLAEMNPGGRGRLPLLVTENYGRGRTAIFATSGSWRWQMQQPVEDMSHEMFWQQMLRWLVSGTSGAVISRTPKNVYSDEQVVGLRAEIRDKNYIPVSDARVEAHIIGPEGISENVELRPDPATVGLYTADWGALKQGSYVVETVGYRGSEEVGRDVLTFRREDGVAENFGTSQNRELLEKLSQNTGGRYWKPNELNKLASDISYSEAGISVKETRDLWDAPVFFMMALLLRSGEWLLRRKWGVV
jgi:uncharacterized membrane protein